MPRNICLSAVDGQTGFLIAELLLTNPDFNKEVDSVTGLSLHPHNAKCKELEQMGATIITHKPGTVKAMAAMLKQSQVDTICVIPPTHKDKYDITVELVNATKQAGVPNVCLVSSVGCDLATMDKQPHLRSFIDLEQLVMEAKGDSGTSTGTSPVVVRAGFYAENLLNYSPQIKEGSMPLPIGPNHSFAPVALGDVALLVAQVLSSKGKNGFADQVRGQLFVLTGPRLVNGKELARLAGEVFGVNMEFEDISPAEAKRVLHAQASSDNSELQYLLEYYSLVKEGKTNYISTCAFHDITGQHPREPDEFFKVYAEEVKPEHAQKNRKTDKK